MIRSKIYLYLSFTVIFMSSFDLRGNTNDSICVLHGALGVASEASVKRFFSEPFTSLPWLRADLSFEEKRIFTNYSGDVSGRYIELMSALSRELGDLNFHPQYLALLQDIPKLQNPSGYFGDPNIDWNGEIDYKEPFTSAKYLPTLWGNNRMMCGLVEAYKTTGDKSLLESAEKLAGFYEMVSKRLTDPKRVAEFTGISADEIERNLPGPDGKIRSTLPVIDATYAGGYVTCFFPIVEGLVDLYAVTKKQPYLDLAKKIGDFHQLFDVTTTTHAHGMLCCYYAYLMIYELTGEKRYLDRVEKRWNDMVDGGYVNATGGTPEGVQFIYEKDEGCANADWLRVNLKLFDITKKARYLEMADRLINNQFIINEWSDGGFGHRRIYCDKNGMYGYQKHFLECVWCCNFHATMGFVNFKDHLIACNSDTMTVYFATDFEATCASGAGKATVVSKLVPGDYSFDLKKSRNMKNLVMSQIITLKGDKPLRLSVRLPDWAKSITFAAGAGKIVAAKMENGYLVSQKKIAPGLTIRVDYHGGIFTENRRLKQMSLQEIRKSVLPEAVFRYGPWTLVGKGLSRIPHLALSEEIVKTNKVNPDWIFDASVPYMPEIHKIRLEKLGYGSENETGVFIFNVSEKVPEMLYTCKIVHPETGKALAVDTAKANANGADIYLADKDASMFQNWIFEEVGDNYVKIVNGKTGGFISESGEGQAIDGRKVHQWDGGENPFQIWKRSVDKNGLVQFVNKGSGRALTLNLQNNPPNTMVWSASAPNQFWRLEKVLGNGD